MNTVTDQTITQTHRNMHSHTKNRHTIACRVCTEDTDDITQTDTVCLSSNLQARTRSKEKQKYFLKRSMWSEGEVAKNIYSLFSTVEF